MSAQRVPSNSRRVGYQEGSGDSTTGAHGGKNGHSDKRPLVFLALRIKGFYLEWERTPRTTLRKTDGHVPWKYHNATVKTNRGWIVIMYSPNHPEHAIRRKEALRYIAWMSRGNRGTHLRMRERDRPN